MLRWVDHTGCCKEKREERERRESADRLAVAACDFTMDQIARGLIVDRVRGSVEPGQITQRESDLRSAAARFVYAVAPPKVAEAPTLNQRILGCEEPGPDHTPCCGPAKVLVVVLAPGTSARDETWAIKTIANLPDVAEVRDGGTAASRARAHEDPGADR